MAWKTTSPPAEEPVTLAEAKEHLNVPAAMTDWDSLITGLIQSARGHVEDLTGQALVTQTVREYFDGIDGAGITLGRYPVQSVAHVKYTDSAGTGQVWAGGNYRTDLVSRRPRITPAPGGSLPGVSGANSIEVEYTCGYGSAADVPAEFKTAIKLLVAELFENRENRAYTLPDRLHNFLFRKMDFTF